MFLPIKLHEATSNTWSQIHFSLLKCDSVCFACCCLVVKKNQRRFVYQRKQFCLCVVFSLSISCKPFLSNNFGLGDVTIHTSDCNFCYMYLLV